MTKQFGNTLCGSADQLIGLGLTQHQQRRTLIYGEHGVWGTRSRRESREDTQGRVESPHQPEEVRGHECGVMTAVIPVGGAVGRAVSQTLQRRKGGEAAGADVGRGRPGVNFVSSLSGMDVAHGGQEGSP